MLLFPRAVITTVQMRHLAYRYEEADTLCSGSAAADEARHSYYTSYAEHCHSKPVNYDER